MKKVLLWPCRCRCDSNAVWQCHPRTGIAHQSGERRAICQASTCSIQAFSN